MLVAPSEPPALRAIGRTSSLPEKFGCDVMWFARGGRVGVQRKEVKDLRASVDDGRLGKELRQMKVAGVGTRVLIVEGKVRFDDDGRLMARYAGRWTRAMWNGVLWGVQNTGMWVHRTDTLAETIEAVGLLERWCAKERHGSLEGRGPMPGNIWGTRPSDREYATWVLQGIDGVGNELASRIYDRFGGLPVNWADEVDTDWLTSIDGIGKKKAEKILRGLDRKVNP